MTPGGLHRLLAARLLVVASLAAGATIILVALNEQSRLRTAVRDRALVGEANLEVFLEAALNAPPAQRRGALVRDLGQFCQRRIQQGAEQAWGHFVLVRLLEWPGTEIMRCADDRDSNLAELEALQRATPLPPVSEPRLRQIGVRRYLRISIPLRGREGDTVVTADAMFAVSPGLIADSRARLWRAALMGVLLVLAASAVLYPVILRLLRRVERLSRDLLDANLEMMRVIGSAIAKRDSETDLHNYRVTMYAVRLAERLGLDAGDIRSLIKGAFLHDVGKIGVPDAVLLKPARLTEAEREEMQRHVDHGLDIIRRSSWLGDAVPVVAMHHEKMDGTGYRRHLKGDEIPVLARIFAIADVFDALSSKRPYKPALALDEVLREMHADRGSHFDPAALDVFEGIAPELHQRYAAAADDGERARADLRDVMARYFAVDLARFLSRAGQEPR